MPGKRHSGISDQHKASHHRLEDARILLAGRRWRGCMYLAGYAVECLLKFKLMQMWRCRTLEDLEKKLRGRGTSQSPFTHSLDGLLVLTGAYQRLRQNAVLWRRFSARVNDWHPAWRYNPDPASADRAEEFLAATREVLLWIEHNV